MSIRHDTIGLSYYRYYCSGRLPRPSYQRDRPSRTPRRSLAPHMDCGGYGGRSPSTIKRDSSSPQFHLHTCRPTTEVIQSEHQAAAHRQRDARPISFSDQMRVRVGFGSNIMLFMVQHVISYSRCLRGNLCSMGSRIHTQLLTIIYVSGRAIMSNTLITSTPTHISSKLVGLLTIYMYRGACSFY